MSGGWRYKTTIKRMYGLTENQIKTAIRMGLVEAKEVRNPYYSSGPPAVLLKVSDVEANLSKIKSLPKYSEEEKARRKLYRERSRLRDELEFYCPRCGKRIRAMRGSEMFEACFEGEVSKEEARRVLMIAHYRHEHTDYDAKRRALNEKRYKLYERLRKEGYDHETAWMIVDDEIPDVTEELKKTYNKKAVELLKEDGLL